MGKKVFEVAQDLGIDHRKILKKCDELAIDVRNYMSVLSESDETRVKAAMTEGTAYVEERAKAPGVRVRRTARKAADKPAARPAQPAMRRAEPKVRARPGAGAPGAKAEKPTPAAKASEAPAKVAKPEAKAESAKVIKADAPKSESAKVVEPPSAATGAAKPQEAPAASNADATAGSKPAGADAAGGDKPEADESKSPSRPAVTSAGQGVTRRVVDRTPAPATQVRQPQPRPSGGAKILGTIPLDQLQRRTARPSRPSRPAPRRSTRPGGGGPPGRGPAPSGPGAAPGGPLPPTDRGDARRRRGAPGTAGRDDRPGGGARTTGRPKPNKRRMYSRDDLRKGNSRTNRGRRRKTSRKGAKTQLTIAAAHKRVVPVNGTISVKQLGIEMGVKGNDLMRQLIQMGLMVELNHQLDIETATLLASEHDHEVKDVSFQEDDVLSGPVEDTAQEVDPDAIMRAPVVTIMGHVDHGKTTLLDSIRKANVAEGEAGGITQHIGAYSVPVGDSSVVFLDTPGHAAFTAMRARGASVTDVIVLVVAADDGVMPQTEESINHARAAGVPLIVAITKVDKPDVDAERIKQEMTKFELVPEEWGGDTMFVPVSGLTGEGVDTLLESLALQAEILELKANPKNPAFGAVVEARMERGRGTVCTVLVQDGTLRQGDYVVAGDHFGRVRAMMDDHGKRVKEAGPSTPVEVLGLNGVPKAGESFHSAGNEKDAKKVAQARADKAREEAQDKAKPNAMDLLAAMGKPEKDYQNLILKTDVSGSLEAIKGELEQLATDEVEVKIIHSGVGPISESDVTLAETSDAVIIGFNVGPDSKAKKAADQARVEIMKFAVIYDVTDHLRDLLSGLLTPETVEVPLGKADVRAVFHVQKIGKVAGCFVKDGKVLRNSFGRIFRAGEKVAEGRIATLKRFKDDVREVGTGYECGLSIEGFDGVQEGDQIEVFELKEVQRRIE